MHRNYIQAVKDMARADYVAKYRDENVLAPDMLGEAGIEVPQGSLVCRVTKVAPAALGQEPVGFYGFTLADKRVAEIDLERMGLGQPKSSNTAGEWARLHIVTPPVKPQVPVAAKYLHGQYAAWAVKQGLPILGPTQFIKALEAQGVVFTRHASGKVAPWVTIRAA